MANGFLAILLVDNHSSRHCKLPDPPCIVLELMNSIEFLREFAPSPGSGSSTPSEKAKPVGAAYKGKAKDNKKYAGADAFIPENVYEALKGLSRFDALRVSRIPYHTTITNF